MKKAAFLLLLFSMLFGCSKPLPEDQQAFVGLWKNTQTALLITQSGRLEYETHKGATKTTLSMPIKRITDNAIIAGFLLFESHFLIAGKPLEKDGLLVLTVDGEELYQANALGNVPVSIPSLAQMREIVNTDLNLLSDGINNKDFTAYLESTSLIYQSQFNAEKLLELYAPFIEQQINLQNWMSGNFALTSEPNIDENGVLLIEGRYHSPDRQQNIESANTQSSLKFSLSYIYSQSNWKSMGGDIDINND